MLEGIKIKGVILAGGLGTRLKPFTFVTNKHLALVYKKVMIQYPLETLKRIGIDDILIVSGGEHMKDIQGFFSHWDEMGYDFRIKLSYRTQDRPGGISHALALAEDFAGASDLAVILGDNYFDEKENLRREFDNFLTSEERAHIFLAGVRHPERFGVPEIVDGKIVDIIEKPEAPRTNFAVTGLYLFKNGVFDFIRTLEPSGRGELEVTDLSKCYIKEGALGYSVLNRFWGDMGEPDTLLDTANYIRRNSIDVK